VKECEEEVPRMEVVFEVWVVLTRWVQQLGLEVKQEEQGKVIAREHHRYDLVMVMGVWRFHIVGNESSSSKITFLLIENWQKV
jgi:hypothetical protein